MSWENGKWEATLKPLRAKTVGCIILPSCGITMTTIWNISHFLRNNQNRSHEDFLVKLSTYYGSLKPTTFFEHVKQACKNEFEIEDVTLKEALAIVDNEVGGMQNWFESKCRTKIVTI
jgi:hypothetical protein